MYNANKHNLIVRCRKYNAVAIRLASNRNWITMFPFYSSCSGQFCSECIYSEECIDDCDTCEHKFVCYLSEVDISKRNIK